MIFYKIIILVSFLNALPLEVLKQKNEFTNHTINNLPESPLLDRAKGLSMIGNAQTAISNYGNMINGYDHHPGGLWNGNSYIPSLSIMSSIPGYKYSHNYDWELHETGLFTIWKSIEAGQNWIRLGDSVFVDFVFNVENDKGDLGERYGSHIDFNNAYQWSLEIDSEGSLVLYITTESELENPNYHYSKMGLVYPWAKRPMFIGRDESVLHDYYDTGPDAIPWNEDDNYKYYGANTNESWFTRFPESSNSDWQPKSNALGSSHNSNGVITYGDIFGYTNFVNSSDSYPILAHSSFEETWPLTYNDELSEYEHFWPGMWADEFDSSLIGCNGSPTDNDCWIESPGNFKSFNDIYMEIDDRWAHQGNYVNHLDEYQNTGYPLGLTIQTQVHSYPLYPFNNSIFFSSKIINESGDYINEDGIFVESMIMPDGSKLNGGDGFNYERMFLGFYFDVDALWADINGSMSNHTNADDMMGYYRDIPENSENFLSFAYIYDYDGISNSINNTAYTALVILDTPRLPVHEESLDLDLDGSPDVQPGEKLGMTSWHWFDWYNRPGVRMRESNSNCCDGSASRPSSKNREEIQYKILAGDTVNISDNEKLWFFHTSQPQNENISDINPHFDSIEGIMQSDFWNQGAEGLDCTVMVGSGPFSIGVGEEVSFSYAIVFAENFEDLIENVKNTQNLYDSHFKLFSSPKKPQLSLTSGAGSITLNWDNNAEESIDFLANINDFEGYKIYRSIDNGNTWGNPIYDSEGMQMGWEPYQQFDLTYEEDYIRFGRDISGYDPVNSWINLGNNTGITNNFIDYDVEPINEYCYYLTSYDKGYINSELNNIEFGDWETLYDVGISSMESVRSNIMCLSPDTLEIYNPPTENLFIPSLLNIGTPEIYFIPDDEQEIIENMNEQKRYKIEILADQNNNDYNYSLPINNTINPRIYIWEVDYNNLPIETQYFECNFDEIYYYDKLPGSDQIEVDSLNNVALYELPIYLIQNQNIDNNWIYFSGMYFKISDELNTNFNLIQSQNIINDIIWSNTDNEHLINFHLEWFNINSFNSQFYSDYQIDFSSESIFEVDNVIPGSGCEDDEIFYVPFEITNLNTNKKVGIVAFDKGSCNCGSGIDPDVFGYKNCQWDHNEKIVLVDTLNTIEDPYGNHYNTFNLYIDWNYDSLNTYPWNNNDNVIIKPKYRLHNGDNWILDMSQFNNSLSIDKFHSSIPKNFNLGKPYPNPFNPVTKIDFTLPELAYVSINIYNIKGRLIEKLQDGILNGGKYQIHWNANNYSSGIYFVQMVSNNYKETHKLVLIK